MRAVLTDDSALILEKLQEFESSCKQAVIVALDEIRTNALKDIRYPKPELAIIDHQMPRLTSREVLKAFCIEDKTIKSLAPSFHRLITKRL